MADTAGFGCGSGSDDSDQTVRPTGATATGETADTAGASAGATMGEIGAGAPERRPNNTPAVTSTSPIIKVQPKGSPKNMTAPNAESTGTTEVIMVERTGPKWRTMVVKVIPDTTTDSRPW